MNSPGRRVQVLEHLREGRARRLLQAQDLDPDVINLQVTAMAVHRAVGNEVVEVRVVLQRGAHGDVRRVVQETPEESEGVAF